MTQFQARENRWRTNVMETKNQITAGVFQNHQFELEARQQWEQRLRSVESLVDEASSYCGDQAGALRNKTDSVINLEAQMADMHTQAFGEVARLGQQALEESQATSRYRGEVHALGEAARTVEHQAAMFATTASSPTAEIRDQLNREQMWRMSVEAQNQELAGRAQSLEQELAQLRTIDMGKRDFVGELTQ